MSSFFLNTEPNQILHYTYAHHQVKQSVNISIFEDGQPVFIQGQIQDLVKASHKNFLSIFAVKAQQSCANKVSPNWLGLRALLRVLEALGFSLLNMHSPHFGVPFYIIF